MSVKFTGLSVLGGGEFRRRKGGGDCCLQSLEGCVCMDRALAPIQPMDNLEPVLGRVHSVYRSIKHVAGSGVSRSWSPVVYGTQGRRISRPNLALASVTNQIFSSLLNPTRPCSGVCLGRTYFILYPSSNHIYIVLVYAR